MKNPKSSQSTNDDPLDPTSIPTVADTDDVSLEEIDELMNSQTTTIPDESGEGAVSGSNADLESDDDMLENMHAVGLNVDEDEDNPQPLNIAQQIEQAEKYHREN